MDMNTLMFIAGQGRQQSPMSAAPTKRPQNAPLRPCYNCSGDHLMKDCPYPRQSRPNQIVPTVPALSRYCLDCGIKHLVSDCPLNPDKAGKKTINMVKSIPSTSETESDEIKPVNVVTRAQKLKHTEEKTT